METDWIERNSHIPTSEIQQDIADTEAEIVQLRREVAGLRLIGDKMSYIRAEAREQGIHEREAFIAKLQQILNWRVEKKEASNAEAATAETD